MDALKSFRNLSDEAWLDLLIQSTKTQEIDGFRFPGFPTDHVQTTYVGSANETSLREAGAFYKLIKSAARRHDVPIGLNTKVLDFGCGWGRYLRFFMKDVDADNLYGCDVSPQILDICRNTGVPGHLHQIERVGALPFPDGHFDVIMAYSVFTHLPESVHLHWMRELARVSRPGAMFCLTLEPRRFIDHIAAIPDDTPSAWYRLLAQFKPRVPEFYARFDAGELVFMPTNANVAETYGDAVTPLSFVRRHWSPLFDVRDYIDNAERFWQAVLVAQRREPMLQRWARRIRAR